MENPQKNGPLIQRSVCSFMNKKSINRFLALFVEEMRLVYVNA